MGNSVHSFWFHQRNQAVLARHLAFAHSLSHLATHRMTIHSFRLLRIFHLVLSVALLGLVSSPSSADPPSIGPMTEARFPPLAIPPRFKATLFACDPLVEYPSVIAIGPRQGSVFVAHDYMTGLGTEIVR